MQRSRGLLFGLWTLLWLYVGSVQAANCPEIWPGAVTENTTATLPAGLIYNPSSPTAITHLNRSLAPGDYTIGAHSTDNGITLTTSGTTTRIFVDGSLVINNESQINASGNPENLIIVVRGSLQVNNNVNIRGFVLVGGSVFFSNNATIRGGLTAVGGISGWNNSLAQYDSSALSRLQGGVVCGAELTCINDDFQSSGLSNNWVVSTSRGTFTPTTVNGRMRLTQNVNNQATASSFQRLFPGAGNLVTIQFDQYAYGRTTSPGGDGVAIVLSDSSVTPQPGAYGGPLGYGTKANENIVGFAGGWVGVGLDEYGNFSSEGGPGGPGRRLQSIAIRGSGNGVTGYRYLAGACNNGTTNTATNCLNPAIDGNQNTLHRYRLTLDSQTTGRAYLTLERDVGSGFTPVINRFDAAAATGQAAVPSKFILSLTGSTGAANNYHELDNVQICALQMEPMGEQIDHFEYVHPGSALTCNPASMTIKACKNTSCSELVTSSVTATLAPTANWSGIGVSGNNVTFSGGSTTVQLRQATAGTVNLNVTSSTPMQKPLAKTMCRVGTTLSTANCALTFADSGFLVDVPTKLANKVATGVKLRAVKSDGSAQCVPSFANVSRTIKLWSDLVSPSTYPGSVPAVTVNSTAIGTSAGTATSHTLSFDSQGESTLAVNYADAGQLRLNARYDGSAATGDSGLLMTGSDLFVSQPAGFCITTPQTCPLSANDAAYASCALYRRAGETFPVTVSAKAWESDSDSSFCTGNLTTKNFVSPSMQLQLDRLAPQVGVTGTLSASQLNFTAAGQGQTQLTTSYHEVGVVRFRTVANAAYEGTTLTATGQQETATGRIGPYQFKLDNSAVMAGCSSFSYVGQPFNSTASFSARSASGAVLSNYQGVFAKASSQLVARDGSTNLSSRLQYTTSAWQQWSAGQLFVSDALLLTRANQPDGPFPATDLGVMLQANDPPGAGSAEPVLEGLNLNPDVAGSCALCTAWKLGSPQQFRYGRVRVLEAFGSELAALPVQLLAEYYNGQQFVSNSLDVCTSVTPSALTASGSPTVSVSGQSGTLQAGISGAMSLMLSAPQQPGIWTLQYDLSTAPWLQYDWQPGQGALLENPTAQAVFGIYRGQNRQIYWREQ